MKQRIALAVLFILLVVAAFALADDASDSTLARLRAGHARVLANGPRAARGTPADFAQRRPVVAVVVPAAWDADVADLLDLYPQDVLRVDADDPHRAATLDEATGRLGVRLVVALAPDAASAGAEAARLSRETTARVEPARLDPATNRIDWLGGADQVAAAEPASAGLPWAALLGVLIAAGLIVWTRRPDWVGAGRERAEAHLRDAAGRLRDRLRPPRPAPEVEAAAEVERIRRDNPQLFAVLGRLQAAQRDAAGLDLAVDVPAAPPSPPPVRLHALLAAERFIPAALAGG